MVVYAGIDEAGYGPVLGPLVVARTVFRIDETPRAFASAAATTTAAPLTGGGTPGRPTSTPCLWTLLSSAVARSLRERGGRVAVADSKRLYNASVGLRHLETGVLGFLGCLDRGEGPPGEGPPGERSTAEAAPGTLDGLLAALGDEELRPPGLPWYGDPGGWPRLPCAAEPAEVGTSGGRLREAARRAGVTVEDLRVDVVFEDRFNALVGRLGSKAACAWLSVGLHLESIWRRFGRDRPLVVIDRQGGRKDYGGSLVSVFRGARVEALERGDAQSRYAVQGGERSMEVVIRVRGEASHLPVALASMTAKYVRELLMTRFRRYWREAAPEVEPTAGYVEDGRRFLREIEPHVRRLGIDPRTLVRCR